MMCFLQPSPVSESGDSDQPRGNRVPENFDGLVFDIGRGAYDHHQKDSRIRENGVPYAAFGLLWEALGAEILGKELAASFDEAFVQPLDNNDNTGEKTNWRLSSAISILPGMQKEERIKPFFRQ